MEQIFGVFGIDWRILTVQVVNFLLLLGILWYVLYRPLVAFIEKRRMQIIEGVAQAERAEAMLKDAGAKRGEIITQATQEGEGIIAAARMAAQEREATFLREAKEKAERMLAEARDMALEEKRRGLAESEAELARLIVLGAEKAVRERRAQATA